MCIKVKIGGAEVECNSAKEVAEILSQLGQSIPPVSAKIKKGDNGKGVAESWREARKFGKKHGIPNQVARSVLTEAKKKNLDPDKLAKERKSMLT